MPFKRMIIAIVGMAGAGKSSAALFFKSQGFDVLRFGDETDMGLRELGLALTEENERKFRESLRKKYGMPAYAIKIEPRIKKTLKTNNKIILDGLYSWEEYVYLKDKFPDLILLGVYTDLNIRYKRLSERKIRSLIPKIARERDIAELINLNKGNPIALADYMILNNGSIESLNQKLKNFLNLHT